MERALRLPAAQLDGADITSPAHTPLRAFAARRAYLFIDDEVAAVRTARYKLVVRSFYRTAASPRWTYATTGRCSSICRTIRRKSYDVSSLHPDALADLTARLTRARTEFGPLKAPGGLTRAGAS